MAEQYDVYHPQGPVISTSLFGDAATAGINAGNALPTPLTAGIQGAVKGYQTGQEIQATDQQNQLRALQLDTAQKTHDLQVQDTTSRLKADNAKVTDELNTRNRENDFTTAFQQASPDQQAQMVIGGQYQDVFNSNPKLFQSALQGVYLNPNNGLDPTTRNSIGNVLKRSTALDYQQKQALKDEQNFQHATDTLYNSADEAGVTIGQIATKLNVLPQEAARSIKIYRSGFYKTKNDAGQFLELDGRGNPIELPQNKQTQDPSQFIAVVPQTGEIIHPNVSAKAAQGIDKFIAADNIHSRYAGIAVNQAAPAPNQQAAQSQPQGIPQVQSEQSQNTPAVDEAIKSKLMLDDKTFEAVKDPIQNIKTQAVAYAKGITSGNAATAQASFDKTISATVRTITDAQYDNNKALQTQYDDAAVKHYNELRTKDYAESFGGSSFAFAKTGIGIPQETLDAFKVNNPKDLYYVTQRDNLEQQLKTISYNIAQAVQNQIQAASLEIGARTANNAFLLGIKQHGAVPGR